MLWNRVFWVIWLTIKCWGHKQSVLYHTESVLNHMFDIFTSFPCSRYSPKLLHVSSIRDCRIPQSMDWIIHLDPIKFLFSSFSSTSDAVEPGGKEWRFQFSIFFFFYFPFVSSVRSSYSHPDLLLIHHPTTPPPTFSDHTGPQHWTFTFWATTAI